MAENKLEIDILINDKEALAKLRDAMRKVENESKSSTDSMNLSWAGFAAKLFIVQEALGPVIDFMKDAVKAANEQEDAIARLNNSLQLQGTFSKSLSASYQAMATSMEKSSRFADDAILQAQQRLVTIGNVAPASMQKATQATLDLAAALRIDLAEASNIVSKAAAGQTQMLERQIPALKNLITDSTTFSQVLDLLNQKFGGSAQADLDTFAGKQAKLANAWNNVLEEMGQFITKSPAITKAMSELAEGAEHLAESLHRIREDNPDFLADAFSRAFDIAKKVMGAEGGIAGLGVEGGMSLVNKIFGTKEDNEQAVVELGEIVVKGQASAQDQALAEQEQKEAEARQKYIEGEVAKIDQLRLIYDQWNNEKTAAAMSQVQAETDFMNLAIQTQQLAHVSMWKTIGKEKDVFTAGIADMFKQMMRGTLDAKEAFKQLGFSMIDILIDQAAQWAVNAALSKALSAAQVGVSASTAAAVAAAWAPAAAAASLATLGSNAAAASAALTTTHALSRALAVVPGLAEGGEIIGGGTVLVGERGPEFLDLPSGARVTPLEKAGRGDMYITIEINNPVITTEESARIVASQIARQVSEFIDNERERL